MRKLVHGICVLFLLSGSAFGLDAGGIKAEVLAKATHSWDGSPLPDYPRGTPEITILRITVPAGAELPLHEHPVINAGVLLKGELTVVAQDNKTLHLRAGDPIVEVVNEWHYGKNEGDGPAEIVVFYAGVRGSPITVKKEGMLSKPVGAGQKQGGAD